MISHMLHPPFITTTFDHFALHPLPHPMTFPIADGRIQTEVGNLGEGDWGVVVERVRWELSRRGTVLVWIVVVVVVGWVLGLVLGVGLSLFK
jgi:hypothetical protein